MSSSLRCAVQRSASILVWLPFLLLAPLFSTHGGPFAVALQLLLVAAMAALAIVAVQTSRTAGQGRLPVVAWLLLAVAVAVGATQGSGWGTPWVLVAITAPAVLRGWWLAAAIAAVTGGSMLSSWLAGERGATFWIGACGGVLLAGVATTSFLRLTETVEELRRTREELARVAVVEERERFSRDLHDLLGHTLSVMVVKAEAVRRLAHRDPDAVAVHAADIEQVGRQALAEVRDAVDAMRTPTLAEELDGARRALDAAGVRTEVVSYDGQLPAATDQALAWVVREAATNVLRHSGAASCRFTLRNGDGRFKLSVVDDGVGGPAVSEGRAGGLDGLRRRLDAVGGSLRVDPGGDGFALTAEVPVAAR
jgi:two-component system sensor histidine kinase DesK